MKRMLLFILLVRPKTRRQSITLLDLSWKRAQLGKLIFLTLMLKSTNGQKVLQVLLSELQINAVKSQLHKYRICESWRLYFNLSLRTVRKYYIGEWERKVLGILWPSKNLLWTSLEVQWIRIRLPMQGTWVQSLVWEDSTCLGAMKPVNHNYWTCALEPGSLNERSHRNEKPPYSN